MNAQNVKANGKEFAPEYREETEVIPPEKVSEVQLQHHTTDITYRTRKGTRTVRARGATTPSEYNEVPEGFLAFWDDGRRYAYNPAEMELITCARGGQHNTLATGDDLVRFEDVGFPGRVPIRGAVTDGVEATVYYRSNRSDKMQTVTVDVSMIEGQHRPYRFDGKRDDGKRVEVVTVDERTVTVKHYGKTGELTLGRVARVEFPRGQRFTVDVEGITDERAEAAAERIKKYASSKITGADTVTVSHEGRMGWD